MKMTKYDPTPLTFSHPSLEKTMVVKIEIGF